MNKIKWILIRIKKRFAAIAADSLYKATNRPGHNKMLLLPSVYILNDEETIERLEEEALERERQEVIRSTQRLAYFLEEAKEMLEKQMAEAENAKEQPKKTWFERHFRKKDKM